ncbi:MAG: hypothetical protein AVDCRST_MAG02-127, partial [uncultured Rubrobacteraceae bacterium]
VPGFLRSAGPRAQATRARRQGGRATTLRAANEQALDARAAGPPALPAGGRRRERRDVARGLGAARSQAAV